MSSVIRFLEASDIDAIVDDFAKHDWPKPRSIFEEYLKEQQMHERLVWIAYDTDQFAGYISLKWKSKYEPFRRKDIPEIMNLSVLQPFRYKSIGSQLLTVAEYECLREGDTAGLGVALYWDYGVAQKLSAKNGYIPDGRGVTYNYEPVEPGAKVILDDNLILWFTKTLR
jgi:GNAT superfamily N-acetyltransferase